MLDVDLELILNDAQQLGLEQLALALFLAVKQVGRLPATLPEIDETQAQKLREVAISVATQVLTVQARGALPVGVTLERGVTRFNVPPRPGQRMISVDVVERYLDQAVERWRAEREAGNSSAAAYIEAFQSVRVVLLGEVKA